MSSNDLWNTLAQGLLGFTISVLIVFIIEKLPLRLTAKHGLQHVAITWPWNLPATNLQSAQPS